MKIDAFTTKEAALLLHMSGKGRERVLLLRGRLCACLLLLQVWMCRVLLRGRLRTCLLLQRVWLWGVLLQVGQAACQPILVLFV